MIKINENYLKLPGSYLFSTIADVYKRQEGNGRPEEESDFPGKLLLR